MRVTVGLSALLTLLAAPSQATEQIHGSAGVSSALTPPAACSTGMPSGTVYYVDFSTGADTNAGTSTDSPWQHAPGDANATDNPRNVVLAPGNTILFKGGVTYSGAIDLPSTKSGTAGSPITYQGASGWGTGQAKMSGLITTPVTFTADPVFSGLADATLPTNMVPTFFAGSGPISSWNSIYRIDGSDVWIANSATGSHPEWLNEGTTVISTSQMTGSGNSWVFTDASLATKLAGLTPAQINNLIFYTYVTGNNFLKMTVTGFDGVSQLSVSGNWTNPKSNWRWSLLNDPKNVSLSSNYPMYAIEGNRMIAVVTPGVHNVSYSALPHAFKSHGNAYITIDCFEISGYGANDGIGIFSQNVPNWIISNNTIYDMATSSLYNSPAIKVVGTAALPCTNTVVTGNVIRSFVNSAAIYVQGIVNGSVDHNTMNTLGWDGVFSMGNQNTDISFNRISHTRGNHAIGITSYDAGVLNPTNPNLQNINVRIHNNQIDDGNSGIYVEGDPAQGKAENCHCPMQTPNNWSVYNNVITNQFNDGGIPCCKYSSAGTFPWTNALKYYSNIMYKTGYVSVYRASQVADINYSNNIFYLHSGNYNRKINYTTTFTNNVAVTATNAAPSGGPSSSNRTNTSLAAVVAAALASPGALPAGICTILGVSSGQKVGIDWSC
jgi:hypothetical protein